MQIGVPPIIIIIIIVVVVVVVVVIVIVIVIVSSSRICISVVEISCRRIWLATSVMSFPRLGEGHHVARPGGQAASEGRWRWTGACRVVPEEVEAVPAERLQMHRPRHRSKFTDPEGGYSAQFLNARLVRTVAMTSSTFTAYGSLQ